MAHLAHLCQKLRFHAIQKITLNPNMFKLKLLLLLRYRLKSREMVTPSYFNIWIFRYFSGNLLTVVALLKCQKLRSHATTMFVISLAVSDLLFCTINLPLTASRYVHEKWILGQDMCRYLMIIFVIHNKCLPPIYLFSCGCIIAYGTYCGYA